MQYSFKLDKVNIHKRHLDKTEAQNPLAIGLCQFISMKDGGVP